MSLILQAFHEYYTAFFKEYQATEILEKSTAEQIRIAAPVKAYLNALILELLSIINAILYGNPKRNHLLSANLYEMIIDAIPSD